MLRYVEIPQPVPGREALEVPRPERLHLREREGSDRRLYQRLPRELEQMRPLTPTEKHYLNAVGMFRTVATADLDERGGGHRDPRTHAVRQMVDLGLVRSSWIITHEIREQGKRDQVQYSEHRRPEARAPKVHVLALTKLGVGWLRANGYDESVHGKLHVGVQKQREAFHDSRLYALTRDELLNLRQQGNTPVAIRTDTALKTVWQKETARLKASGMDQTDAKNAAAEAMQLPIVDGKVQIPDVRIDYERDHGLQAYVDLELVSDTYREGHKAAKNAAGFKSVGAGSVGNAFRSQGGRSVWDPDLMSELMGR